MMNREKEFDCVKFKNELQASLLKKSGAKNIWEYAKFVNEEAKNWSRKGVTKNAWCGLTGLRQM